MKPVETPEFSIEANPMFENVSVFAGSIRLRPHPETTFSPQMSVWATEREKRKTPEKWLSECLKRDGAKVVERRAVSFAGMTGEMSKVKDRLEDWETREKRAWYRQRAILASPDGSTWFHATAMASAPDLAQIEADFTRMLASLRIKIEGEAAVDAKAEAEAEKAAVLERLKHGMEHMADALDRESSEEQRGEKAAGEFATPDDIEKRFNAAVGEAGLKDKRDALRLIVLPTVAMIEGGIADPGITGLSRIGGGPDLPAGTDWPSNDNGFHLNFLAQINLADLPDRPETLPESGLISFFIGTDYTDGRVLYAPGGTDLVAHGLAADAAEIAISASQMIVWDSDLGRFVPNGQTVDGLSVTVNDAGRMTFHRDGTPVSVFASEYEFSCSAQTLRFARTLSAPFGLPGIGSNPKAYADIGIENPSDFAIAMSEQFKIGSGPNHQMFGISGVREMPAIQKMAAHHAAKSGWTDIATPDDWFILIKLASGGEADFSFSDHGDLIFMANRKDVAQADFSRVYAFVESG